MNIYAQIPDERVLDVRFDDHSLIVDLMDCRTISVPLIWYPGWQARSRKNARIGKNAAVVMAFTGPTSMKI